MENLGRKQKVQASGGCSILSEGADKGKGVLRDMSHCC